MLEHAEQGTWSHKERCQQGLPGRMGQSSLETLCGEGRQGTSTRDDPIATFTLKSPSCQGLALSYTSLPWFPSKPLSTHRASSVLSPGTTCPHPVPLQALTLTPSDQGPAATGRGWPAGVPGLCT